MPTGGYKPREGKVYSMRMDSRVLNFHSLVCDPHFFHSGAPFNILPLPCWVYSIPTPVQTLQWATVQFYQPVRPQDVSKQHWGKMFHASQFLSLFLYKANALCMPHVFSWTMQVPWHHHIRISQNPRLEKQLSLITGTRVNLFLLLKKEKKKTSTIQRKGLTDIKIIFV